MAKTVKETIIELYKDHFIDNDMNGAFNDNEQNKIAAESLKIFYDEKTSDDAQFNNIKETLQKLDEEINNGADEKEIAKKTANVKEALDAYFEGKENYVDSKEYRSANILKSNIDIFVMETNYLIEMKTAVDNTEEFGEVPGGKEGNDFTTDLYKKAGDHIPYTKQAEEKLNAERKKVVKQDYEYAHQYNRIIEEVTKLESEYNQGLEERKAFYTIYKKAYETLSSMDSYNKEIASKVHEHNVQETELRKVLAANDKKIKEFADKKTKLLNDKKTNGTLLKYLKTKDSLAKDGKNSDKLDKYRNDILKNNEYKDKGDKKYKLNDEEWQVFVYEDSNQRQVLDEVTNTYRKQYDDLMKQYNPAKDSFDTERIDELEKIDRMVKYYKYDYHTDNDLSQIKETKKSYSDSLKSRKGFDKFDSDKYNRLLDCKIEFCNKYIEELDNYNEIDGHFTNKINNLNSGLTFKDKQADLYSEKIKDWYNKLSKVENRMVFSNSTQFQNMFDKVKSLNDRLNENPEYVKDSDFMKEVGTLLENARDYSKAKGGVKRSTLVGQQRMDVALDIQNVLSKTDKSFDKVNAQEYLDVNAKTEEYKNKQNSYHKKFSEFCKQMNYSLGLITSLYNVEDIDQTKLISKEELKGIIDYTSNNRVKEDNVDFSKETEMAEFKAGESLRYLKDRLVIRTDNSDDPLYEAYYRNKKDIEATSKEFILEEKENLSKLEEKCFNNAGKEQMSFSEFDKEEKNHVGLTASVGKNKTISKGYDFGEK